MSSIQTGKHAGNASKKGKSAGKIVLLVIGILIAVVLAVYLIGVAVFSNVFFPNTFISDKNISMQSAKGVAEQLDDIVKDYTFEIKGQGLDLTVTAQQAGLQIDSQTAADAMLSSQNPWEWPFEAFSSRDDISALASSLSASGLADVINTAVAARNETATAPTDATIKYNATTEAFAIVAEAPGTCLDSSKVLNTVLEGALSLESTIRITTDDLAQPSITSDDPRLIAALNTANADIDKSITITYNGTQIAKTDKATIASWISISSDLAVTFDISAVTAWANELASKYNTVGSTRTYTRPDGKTVTVSGGDYGWQINTDQLVSDVVAAIESGASTTTIEMAVWQSANALTQTGNRDFGSRYIDVDLTEQFARFYDESGNIIWSASIVSGEGNTSHATPQGTYSLNLKQSPSTLIGEMTSEGVPEYETTVQYWMPFEGNAVGFHDATWQSAFGGTRYLEGYGSHGCINLSLNDAAALYNLIQIGDVVVVHS